MSSSCKAFFILRRPNQSILDFGTRIRFWRISSLGPDNGLSLAVLSKKLVILLALTSLFIVSEISEFSSMVFWGACSKICLVKGRRVYQSKQFCARAAGLPKEYVGQPDHYTLTFTRIFPWGPRIGGPQNTLIVSPFNCYNPQNVAVNYQCV